MPPGLKRYALPGWCALLSLLILAPVLAPGYVLSVDMVFVPHQTLLPWNLGIGAGLPRSVPQDAVVSLIAGPIAGEVIQKGVLFASVFLAGYGAARLSGGPLLRQAASATLYVWSAYLAARLLIGHWGLLWSFGLLPWVVLAARSARVNRRWLAVAALCGAGALVPTGGVVLAIVAVPLATLFGSAMRVAGRWSLLALVILFNAPWWFATLRSGLAGRSDALGLVVFGSRADGPGGVLVSALAGGGIWNESATLGSRTTPLAILGVLIIVVLALLGLRAWHAAQPAEAVWLGTLGVVGVLWAWISGVGAEQGWAQAIVSGVPGGGLLRDGQKWTIFWVLVLALAAPLGLQRVIASGERSLRIFLSAALVVLPLALLPDLAVGGFGRLRTATYPDAWSGLRDWLAHDRRGGDVLSLPWSTFRRYQWNRERVVLDPLPRYLTRTVVWNDNLPVALDREVVLVGGDDPRAAAVTAAIEEGRPLAPVLKDLGIRWVVVQTDQPQPGPEPNLAGTELAWSDADLRVREVRGDVEVRTPRDSLVVAVDLLALLAWLVVVVRLGAPRARRFMISVMRS